MEVCGRNLRNGLGAIIKVHSGEIREAMSDSLEHIIRAIGATLEQTPPELSSDIYDFGIMLTGGGALTRGIGRLIEERTGLHVTVAKRPLESVCAGILRVIETEDEFGSLLNYRGR
jgi:rod shape-determining protein MreB